jgi:hypothetical protein
MTHLGHLLPISRHGLNRKTNSGPLSKCSFEEVMDQLFEAALHGERDPILDVTSRVMVGRRANVGTGVCRAVPRLAVQRPAEASDEEGDDEDIAFALGDDTEALLQEPRRAPDAGDDGGAGRKRYRPSSPSRAE